LNIPLKNSSDSGGETSSPPEKPSTTSPAASPPKVQEDQIFQEIEDDIDHVMQKIESQQKKNEQLQQRVNSHFFLILTPPKGQ
jgi:hypothetical protein